MREALTARVDGVGALSARPPELPHHLPEAEAACPHRVRSRPERVQPKGCQPAVCQPELQVPPGWQQGRASEPEPELERASEPG